MSDILGPLGVIELADTLVERGYPWKRVDEAIDKVAEKHVLVDEDGQYTRDFTVSLILEVMDLLGPVPKKAGRRSVAEDGRTTRVVVTLPAQLVSRIDERAAEDGVTRSALVRSLLETEFPAASN